MANAEHGLGSATRLRWLAPPLILGAVLTAFEPALEGGFVNWDDDKLIEQNPSFRGFSGEHLAWMLTTRAGGHWHPLTWLSLAVDDAAHRAGIWSLEPFGFHLTNVLLHAVSALLVYALARRLIVASMSDTVAPSLESWPVVVGATLASLVFAVHPLRVESVAWVTERRDVLCMTLMLATTVCYLRSSSLEAPHARASGHPTPGSPSADPPPVPGDAPRSGPCTGAAWRIASFGLFGLALLSKATALVLPAMLVVLDFYPLRRFRDSPAGSRLARFTARKWPLWIASAAAAAMAWSSQRSAGAAYSLTEYPLGMRLAQACQGLVFYAQKTLVPTGLGPLIQIPSASVVFGWRLWMALPLVLAGVALAWRLRRVHPWLATSMAIYLIALAPVLGIFQSGPQFVADRYSYLACLPAAVLLGAFVTRRLARMDPADRASSGAATLLLSAALVGVLHKVTVRQSEHWRDSLSLWRQGVRACPDSSIAHVQYANVLANQALGLGDRQAMDIALDHYRFALQRDPKDAVAWHYLGRGLLVAEPTKADLEEARDALQRAIGLSPGRTEAYADLSEVYSRLALHDPDGAAQRTAQPEQILREGVVANPDSVALLNRLALRLIATPAPTGESIEEALRCARRASALREQKDPETLLTLARILAVAGDIREARSVARQAAALAEQTARRRVAEEARHMLETLDRSTADAPR